MGKPKYMLADIDAAKSAVTKVKGASDEIRALCKVIGEESKKVAELNATFSTNTQVGNRYDQLEKLLGDTAPMLDEIAATVEKLVKQSAAALEESKNKRI